MYTDTPPSMTAMTAASPSISVVRKKRRDVSSAGSDNLNSRKSKLSAIEERAISRLLLTLRNSDSSSGNSVKTFGDVIPPNFGPELSVKTFNDVIPLDLGPDVSTSTRLQTLAQMQQKSYFKVNWDPNMRKVEKDLCVHIIQDILSNMDARSRDEVFHRSFFSQKRRAPEVVMHASQVNVNQQVKQPRLDAWFEQNGKQNPGTVRQLPIAATQTGTDQKLRIDTSQTNTTHSLRIDVRQTNVAHELPADATQIKPRDEAGSSAIKLSPNVLATANAINIVDQKFSILRPTCPVCNQVVTIKKKRQYSHTNQKGAFYYIFQCCNKEFSHLGSLPKLKKFNKLLPPWDLAEWSFHNNKWRLYCRGREWTRCQYCEALFFSYTGKNQYHTKSECPLSKLTPQKCELIE